MNPSTEPTAYVLPAALRANLLQYLTREIQALAPLPAE
jgi:hypothetical protein